MLSFSVVGDIDYYTKLAGHEQPERYYLSPEQTAGVWFGRGAESLGLRGRVEPETFKQTLRGFHPSTGAAMVKNAGEEDRRMGYDLTFSAPKSVSILWAMADPATRRAIEEAHQAAVRTTLAYLEEIAGKTRRGKGGHDIQQAGLVYGIFLHGTSRANQAQLHSHAVLINCGVREDGSTGTLFSTPLYHLKMALGALFRAEFATGLQERLHLPLRREQSWFQIDGIPEALCRNQSTRRQEIEAVLGAAKGSARASEAAALATRRPKEDRPVKELSETWALAGRQHGFGPREAAEMLTQVRKTPALVGFDPEQAVGRGLERLLQKQSHFTEMELVRYTAEEAQIGRVGLRGIVNAVRSTLTRDAQIVALGTQHEVMRYTTQEMLALERRLLAAVERSRGDVSQTVRASITEGVLHMRSSLKQEQREAVRVLTQNPGWIQAVSGFAGTLKTTLLDACREAWQRGGLTVRGAALSGKAAQGLQQTAHIASDTLHRTLQQIESRQWTVTPKTVMVLDEASMVGTKQMERLIAAVERGGGKLVLIGDPKQLQAIEAGGPFQSLVHRYGAATLTEIQRQREPWAREAVRQFAEGKADMALRAFAERGLLTVARTRIKAMEALIDHWKTRPEQELADTLILTSTRAEATWLNRTAQAARRERGAIGGESLLIGNDLFHVGDRVLLTRNSRLYGVQNGALGAVVGLAQADRRRMTVLLDNARRVTLDVDHYPHLKLGYAVTTHKAQGATVENAYVLTGGSMQDLHLAYVQASRARGETRLFVDRTEAGENLRDLIRASARSREKNLGADVQDAAIGRDDQAQDTTSQVRPESPDRSHSSPRPAPVHERDRRR